MNGIGPPSCPVSLASSARSFQIASGVYLAFYVLGHMDSVFIFARTYLGIDTGWGFATGAPTGISRCWLSMSRMTYRRQAFQQEQPAPAG